MEIKERKVNEVFMDFNGNKVKAVNTYIPTCINCCYSDIDCCKYRGIIGPCASADRSDDKDVIFKEENDNEK